MGNLHELTKTSFSSGAAAAGAIGEDMTTCFRIECSEPRILPCARVYFSAAAAAVKAIVRFVQAI
jgi:hypothetical protein